MYAPEVSHRCSSRRFEASCLYRSVALSGSLLLAKKQCLCLNQLGCRRCTACDAASHRPDLGVSSDSFGFLALEHARHLFDHVILIKVRRVLASKSDAEAFRQDGEFMGVEPL